MKTTRIRICKTGLPHVGGTCAWGSGTGIGGPALRDLDGPCAPVLDMGGPE